MTKDLKFLNIAQSISRLSKDPQTKVGAIILGPAGEGGPWGYNGAPRGCKADEDGRFATREEKMLWAEHAERNAIYAAARTSFSTVGGTMYITHAPCIDCARAIVQAGIKKVFFPEPSNEFLAKWSKSFGLSAYLFHECGVEMVMIDPEDNNESL
jgi:dCMP deaminase